MKIYRAVLTGNKKSYCRDYADYMRINDKYFAFALSDGAGSVSFSDLGARDNCQAFFSFLRDYKDQDIFSMRDEYVADDVVNFCKKALADTSSRLNIDIKQLSATFIGVAVSDDEIIICHIGDGEVYALINGKTVCISEAKNIMGISNRTHFTAEKDAVRHMRIDRVSTEGLEAVFMVSDGVFENIKTKEQLSAAEDIFAKLKNGVINDCPSLAKEIDREQRDDHSMILIEFDGLKTGLADRG